MSSLKKFIPVSILFVVFSFISFSLTKAYNGPLLGNNDIMLENIRPKLDASVNINDQTEFVWKGINYIQPGEEDSGQSQYVLSHYNLCFEYIVPSYNVSSSCKAATSQNYLTMNKPDWEEALKKIQNSLTYQKANIELSTEHVIRLRWYVQAVYRNDRNYDKLFGSKTSEFFLTK